MVADRLAYCVCEPTAKKMMDEIDRLRADRIKLIDALAFYGDAQTYHAITFWFDPPCGGFEDDFDDEHGEPFYDREMPGKLARETLRELR